MTDPKVLVVATSRMTRGGITSVVKAHETGEQWKKYHCKWIQTHRDGNLIRKVWYFFRAIIQYILLLPFYNIVHIHLASGMISAYRKLVFIVLAKIFNKKIIIHYHPSGEKWLFQSSNKVFYRNLFSQADLILVLSEQWKKWVKEALGLSDKVEVLYNPCPIVNRKEDMREKYILFAGTINSRKGYSDLLQGFAKISSKYPDWRIVFAGNGEIEKAQTIAKELNIGDKVCFLGWIIGEKKEQVFQKASIYCLASDGEGFPMGVLDAWAYGIPCVVTPVGGIPDIVKDGVNGLIFNVKDIDTLAFQLEKLILNENLRKCIVKETDKDVYGAFNLTIINHKLDEIYSII